MYVRMFELPDDLSGEALPGEMIPNAESILQMIDAVGPGQRLVTGLLSTLGCREHKARFTDDAGTDTRLEILLKASGADGVVGFCGSTAIIFLTFAKAVTPAIAACTNG